MSEVLQCLSMCERFLDGILCYYFVPTRISHRHGLAVVRGEVYLPRQGVTGAKEYAISLFLLD